MAKLLCKQLITIVHVLPKGRSLEFHPEGYQSFCFRKRSRIFCCFCLCLHKKLRQISQIFLNYFLCCMRYNLLTCSEFIVRVLYLPKNIKDTPINSACWNLWANVWHSMLYLRIKYDLFCMFIQLYGLEVLL